MLPALIVPRSALAISTIKLAVDAGAAEQFWFVAVVVSDADAVPAVSEVPVVWPLVSAHSTEYGTEPLPLERVNALAAPLPDAVIVYALVAVLDHTQTF